MLSPREVRIRSESEIVHSHHAQLLAVQQTFRRVGLPSDLIKKDAQPDTTAIILNWSRFPNVKRIASLLCSPILDSVIAEVFIWNNSPNKITHDVRECKAVVCPGSPTVRCQPSLSPPASRIFVI